MNELTRWTCGEFQIRTLTIDDEPHFVGKDVAEVLGYTNSRKALADHVDDEDKGVTKCDTLGGTQELTIINESGLYSLIFSSKLPTAKQFKRWVTSDVLPAIRKTGRYSPQPESLNRQEVRKLRELHDLNMLRITRASKETALALAQIEEIKYLLHHPEIAEYADYILGEVKK